MKKLLLLGLAVAMASAAWSMPTVLGPTGAFLLPTAEVQQGVSISIDTLDAMSFAFKYPFTKIVVGVGSNIEVGAGYVGFSEEFGPGSNMWDLFGKITLPYEIAKGKIAAGLLYASSESDEDGWLGTLTGTWPVFSDSSFTAGILFSRFDDDNETSFGFALEKPYENFTVGVEWLFSIASMDFGTVYAKIPLNDKFSGRIALTGLGEATIIDLGAEMKL